MRAVAVLAIDGYQRFISPHKGFRCAHHVLHAQGGCSGYGRRVILEHGLMKGLVMLRRRFAACKAAAATLQAMAAAPSFGKRNAPQSASVETEDERKRRRQDCCSGMPDISGFGNCGSPASCDGLPSLGCSAPADAIDVCSVGDACACAW